MYGQAVAQMKAGRAPQGVPKGGKPVQLVGAVPFSREDGFTVPLLDSLAEARTVITAATDEKGQVLLSRGLFWLTDRAGAEALNSEAYRKARAAANAPESCQAPKAR